MSNNSARPPIRVRLRFNIDTSDIEFIVDDISPDRSEAYHNKIANAIASFLERNPDIRDAGPIRYRLDQEWHMFTDNNTQGRPPGPGGGRGGDSNTPNGGSFDGERDDARRIAEHADPNPPRRVLRDED